MEFFITNQHVFSKALLKSNHQFFLTYHLPRMGRKPNARRDAYGAWLHHLRKEKALTQQEVAKLTGIPQTTLAYWERTGNLTGRKVILKMAKALGVSLTELLRARR